MKLSTTQLPDLPVAESFPALKSALNGGSAVLCAPPGSGKTTLVPLALLNEPWLKGQRILMLEPRRLATRAAAQRMAELIGEPVGQTVGYSMRQESRKSAATRIEVVTEGLLTRRLQHDPELAGVGLVIFDELHERNLHADVALALCLDARANLRDDLRILAMSATLDSAAVSKAFGGPDSPSPAPVIEASGRSYPVAVKYLGNSAPSSDLRDLIPAVDGAVRLALEEQTGHILVFLPGRREIDRCRQQLHWLGEEQLFSLHGDMSAAAQKRSLASGPNADTSSPTNTSSNAQRVILSSAIAETSLTIPGVGAVIDAGLARIPAFDPNSGFTRLETRRVSRASATQRSGRAGRLGPGIGYRLWSESAHSGLNEHLPAEIDIADLAPMRLELAAWGETDPQNLSWLSPPPNAHWQQAGEILKSLGAIGENGRITKLGQQMALLPLHPRLAKMLCAAPQPLRKTAADLAALLAERDPLPRQQSSDIEWRLEALQQWRNTQTSAKNRRNGQPNGQIFSQIDQLSKRLQQLQPAQKRAAKNEAGSLGALLLQAYPERLAMFAGSSQQPGRLKLANKRGGQLTEGDPLTQWVGENREQLLVIADLNQRERDGWVRLAAKITLAELQSHFASQLQEQSRCDWNEEQQRFDSEWQLRYQSLVLQRKRLSNSEAISTAAMSDAWLRLIRQKGLAVLQWEDSTYQLHNRHCLMQALNSDWPASNEVQLLADLENWLAPHLPNVTTLAQLKKLPWAQLLNDRLDWPQQSQLKQQLPTELTLPNGPTRKIDYRPVAEAKPPIISAKLQHFFGVQQTPTIANGRVSLMVHLLSPAQRPLQVTQDLANFWANTYGEVRKEMRGRYPKHDWPENPLDAKPYKPRPFNPKHKRS